MKEISDKKKILVAMDSFKGCLDSYSASQSTASGLRKIWRNAQIINTVVSDGGEDMVKMLWVTHPEFEYHTTPVGGPLGKCVYAIWIRRKEEDGWQVYMDFSSASGLTLIKEEEKRNPLHTTSFGVGTMIDHALSLGDRSIRLGLGGSATVDAGLGALQAMGLKLIGSDGYELTGKFTGSMLTQIADIEITDAFKEKVSSMKLTLLCDVEALFTGERGAARVFGPQKGADVQEVELLERGMENVRRIILDKTGIDLNRYPGSGAAGGAAGGLMALAGGEIRRGAATLLDLCGFDREIEDVDLIITGEGSSDRQTLMGKIPYEILMRGKRRGIPVWLVAGRVSDREELLRAGFDRIICANSPDIVWRSGTVGMNPMDPEVAEKRLASILNPSD